MKNLFFQSSEKSSGEKLGSLGCWRGTRRSGSYKYFRQQKVGATSPFFVQRIITLSDARRPCSQYSQAGAMVSPQMVFFTRSTWGRTLLLTVLLIIKLPAFFVKRCLFQPIQHKAAEQKQQQGAISRQAPVHNEWPVHKGRRRNILRENMHGNA